MKRSVGLATLVCIATSATGALAREAPAPSTLTPSAPAVTMAPKPVIVQPVWLRRPTAGDVARVYPRGARRDGISGRVVIRCRVNSEGRLERCEIASETPSGLGFAEAAIKLSARFIMSTATKEGVPVTGALVNIPLLFRPPGSR